MSLQNRNSKILYISSIIIYLFISSVFSISYAQSGLYSLTGTILDSYTNEPLVGATVFIKDINLGAAADENGFFRLDNLKEGNYKVNFSFVGYEAKTKSISIGNTNVTEFTDIVVKLKPTAESLEQVTIIAKSKARKLRERAMPISVISMNSLNGTVNSVSDVLTKTVGVTLRSSGGIGGATRVSLRGLEGKRIGFFIDETPMNDQSDFIDINDIPIEMIDRIEIYKGVVPAKFGGSAMGGAVNIVIKEYPDKYLDVSYGLESFNTHKSQLVFKRNIKDKGIILGGGGGFTFSDNDYVMESPYTPGLMIKRNHDKYKKLLIGGNVKFTKLWFDEIEFEPSYVRTYKQIQGIVKDVRKAETHSDAILLANNLKKKDFFLPGLDLDMSTTFAYTMYGLVDTARYWYDWYGNEFSSFSIYGGELGNRYASDSHNKKISFFNKLNFEYIINANHSLSFNTFFTLANGYPKNDIQELSMGKVMVFDSKMRSLVAGITYDARTTDDKLLNSLTLRYYLYSMDTKKTSIYGSGDKVFDVNLLKNDVGFSDAIRYRILPDFMAKASVAYDVRVPSESELLGDGYAVSASENLLPERNTSVNLGLLYDLTGKHSTNLQVELNGYYMYLQNMIRYTKGLIGAQYQNFGEMRTLGIEFETKADIFKFLYGYVNVTYQDLRDVRKYEDSSTVPNSTRGKRMPNIPYFLVNGGLEFHKENLFGGRGQNTRVLADCSFIEEYFYDFEVTANQKRRIPRSFTVDLTFEHSFFNNTLFISAKVRNLTNAKVLSEFNRPLPGRNFGVKIRYVLK